MNKPLILITNDDGIDAKGIAELVNIARPFGDIVVVAPDGPRSAQSNALTVVVPIHYKETHKEDGLTMYKCSGTPTDCIKLSLNHKNILPRRPDLILSGINHGSNAAINVIYSGTMGATLEGCVNNIPSIGFSLCSHHSDADFSPTHERFSQIIKQVMDNGLPTGVCLNVNAPKGEIKGIKICQQAKGYWAEEFDARQNPHGHDYFWLTGHFINLEKENENTDEYALAHGYISVVPTRVDLTDYDAIKSLEWLQN